MFEESSEFYQYMSIVDEEKLGFKKLIDIKEKLFIELKDFKLEQEAAGLERSKELMSNTRAGGMPEKDTAFVNLEKDILERDIIVVDSREFSSLTPVYLHEKGFWLIPMVLTIGDYILSDDICIERKSVLTGDLFESFKSGRLLQQITNMVRFYKRPILLIEFDESIPFKLSDGSNDSALGGDVNPASIISKITLLTLHFPSLQIIWSKGPSHTAEIFRDIRKTPILGGVSTKDPDLQKISKIGSLGESGAIEDLNEDPDDDNDYKKYLPSEFLKRLPGVDSNNINKITKNLRTIVDVSKTSEDDLK
jgi:DNA excision repair protein ERCC-4